MREVVKKKVVHFEKRERGLPAAPAGWAAGAAYGLVPAVPGGDLSGGGAGVPGVPGGGRKGEMG